MRRWRTRRKQRKQNTETTDFTKQYIYAAAAKSLQLWPTLCDPIDGSPPDSPVPGILQARTLEWFAISFSNAWKWKVKVKSLSRVRPSATPWTAAYQAPLSMGFSRQEYWSGVPSPSPKQYIYMCVCMYIYIYIHTHRCTWYVSYTISFMNLSKSIYRASQVALVVKDLPAREGDGTHSSTLAWRIPWTEEPGALQSMGSRRVGHDWATSLSLFTFLHWRRKWHPTPVLLPGESQGRGSLVGCGLRGRTELDTTEVT